MLAKASYRLSELGDIRLCQIVSSILVNLVEGELLQLKNEEFQLLFSPKNGVKETSSNSFLQLPLDKLNISADKCINISHFFKNNLLETEMHTAFSRSDAIKQKILDKDL
jgi:geranylgeranyl pyrophosphate synthase